MEVKHQVFVSSTYEDLRTEREHVMRALLELDCIPAGMELFPAADEDSWALIKEVIDSSDYYVLIVAGRYGSTNAEGVSFTEMEYNYAISQRKRVLTFVHGDPGSISSERCEEKDEGKERLKAFLEKIKEKQFKTWTSPEDLGGKVSRSLVQLRKKHPSPGWVRGEHAASEEQLRELQTLREQVAELRTGSPEGTEELAQGDDQVLLCTHDGFHDRTPLYTTWSEIFAHIGNALSTECTEHDILDRLTHLAKQLLRRKGVVETFPRGAIISPNMIDRIITQFRVLRLIAPGVKKRAVGDQRSYWRLTPHGTAEHLKHSAIPKGEVLGEGS